MTNEEYLNYISNRLTERELLTQLAEEAVELAHAALKTCRALEESNNSAGVSDCDTWDHIDEEMADVFNAYCAVHGDFSVAASALMDCAGSPKWQRWYERVKRAQGVQE